MTLATRLQADIEIRPIVPEKHPKLDGLFHYISRRTYNEAGLRSVDARTLAGSYVIFVAHTGDIDRPWGFVRADEQTPQELTVNGQTRRVGEIGSLWVHYALRGQDIATRLVSEAGCFLEDNGIRPVAVCNPVGKNAFTGIGFEELGRIPGHRTVVGLPPTSSSEALQVWENGGRGDWATALPQIDRFREMRPITVV